MPSAPTLTLSSTEPSAFSASTEQLVLNLPSEGVTVIEEVTGAGAEASDPPPPPPPQPTTSIAPATASAIAEMFLFIRNSSREIRIV